MFTTAEYSVLYLKCVGALNQQQSKQCSRIDPLNGFINTVNQKEREKETIN